MLALATTSNRWTILPASAIPGLLFLVGWTFSTSAWAQDLNDLGKARVDYLGDPLPSGAVLRLGTERFRHPGPIRSLSFSKDGQLLISRGYEDESTLWDVQTGKRVGHHGFAKHLLLNYTVDSLDDRYLVAFNHDASEIRLLDKKTGKHIFTRTNKHLWYAVGFPRDGKRLVALSRNNQVTSWDIASGAEQSRQRFELALWSLASADPPRPVLAREGSILAGVLQEDWEEKKLLTRVRFWDPTTGKECRPAIMVPRWWKHWSLSDDGQLLTVHYWDSEIQLWDTVTGKKTQLAKGGDFGAEGVLHLPEKKLAVLSGWEIVYLQDLEKNKVVWFKEVAPPYVSGPRIKNCRVNRFALSPDGQVVAAGTDNGHIELLDLATGKRRGGSRLHSGFFTQPFFFLPDGKTALVTLGWKTVLWDLPTGKKIRDLGLVLLEDSQALSPNGQWLAHFSFGKEKGPRLCLQEIMSGKELWWREADYQNLCFSEDSSTLALFSKHWDAPDVRFLSTASGQVTRTLQPRVDGPQKSSPGRPFALSRDMKKAAIETTDRASIQVWDAVAGKKLWTWKMPADCREHLSDVHFLPGGQNILVEMASRTDIKDNLFLLDAATGKQLQAMASWNVRGFSPDGRYFAFETSEGEKTFFLEVCDVATGKSILKEKQRSGDRGRYGCFSADSRVFACNLDDTSIEFFDLQAKKRLGPPRPHSAYIRQLAFARDRNILAACYNDSTVILWDADSPSP